MPELPEVETVVRGLSRHIVGQKINHVEIKNARSFLWSTKVKPTAVLGHTVKSVSRRGKGIIINLSKDYSLLIHLKMTGQLIYIPSLRGGKPTKQSRLPRYARNDKGRLNFGHPDKNFEEEMPSKHTRVWLELSKGTLYFNDQRKFGWVKVTATKDIPQDKFIKTLGIEPFDKKFTSAFLWDAIQHRPRSNIKAVISDQKVVAGLGNIYSDEALFYSHLRPTRLGKTITKPETTKLHSAIQKVLRLGIKHSGTSIANYKDAEGLPGNMQKYLAVYDRKGLPCHGTCKGKVEKIRLNGRGTHFCPACQE